LKRRIRKPGSRHVLVMVAFVTLVFAPLVSARGSSWDNRPKILLHAQEITSKTLCNSVSITSCSDAVTEVALVPGEPVLRYVYLLAGRGDVRFVGGFTAGISYQANCPGNMLDASGIDIFAWSLCAGFQLPSESPQWPEPYSGNTITWDELTHCQTGDMAIAGYFYVAAYSDDVIQVIKHPISGKAEMITCCPPDGLYCNDPGAIDYEESDLGFIAFSASGKTPGCNPCIEPCPGPLIAPPPPECILPPPPPPPPPLPQMSQPAILIHLTAATSKNACSFGALESCSTAVVRGGLSNPVTGPFYFANVLANRGSMDDVAGIQFGIAYDNYLPNGARNNSKIDIFSWTLCATLEWPTPLPAWPNPGSGNLVTWNTVTRCQTGATAVAGYFYVAAYSADILSIVPRPVDSAAKLADCDAVETLLGTERLGSAAFSAGFSTEGCNPCLMFCEGVRTVSPTTWSGIKTLFR
jgi:hypothetical protein